MIDYHKLKPFKVNCKTAKNSQRLQKLLQEQGICWENEKEMGLSEVTLLFISEDNTITYSDSVSYFRDKEFNEIPIERLIPKPKLKKFLEEYRNERI